MRKHFIIAGMILGLEAWLGIGLFGGGVGMLCAIVFSILAVAEKQRRVQRLRATAIYVMLIVATLAVISSSARLAQAKAVPVITAVNRFHSEHGRYPATLDELVPAHLSSIPHAGFTLVSRDYQYHKTRPQLYFAVMFHGVLAYDFPTQSWTTND